MNYVSIGLLAHVDAGKTTVTEQILYHSGALRSAGTVDKGTTLTDYMEVERERGITVKAASAAFTAGELTVSLIDTPGHADFASEVERSLLALDMAVLVVSAAEGIQAQTELLLDALRTAKLPTVIFINKIDRAGSHAEGILAELKEKYRLPVLSFSRIAGEEEKSCSAARRTLSEPAFLEESMDVLTEEDEALLERWLEGGALSPEEWREHVRRAFFERRLVPVFAGSAMYDVGVKELLDFLLEYAGQPKNRADGALSGVVYRVTHDGAMGRIAHVRLFGGALHSREEVELSGREPQKISQIRRYTGSRYLDLGTAEAGDVVALCGLSGAKASDIIGTLADELHLDLTVPFLKVRAVPESDDQLVALHAAFAELEAEDPKLAVEYIPEEKELDVSTTGSVQLEVLSALVRERYGLAVRFSKPTVIYKETPIGRGNGFDAYTLPKPCWAVVSLDIEPGERGSGLEYHSVVPNKDILYRYQNHIQIAVPRALKQGLYNWEVTDVKVTLVGGNHHPIHTHPMDFFLATPIAVMKGLVSCSTTLLEPMQKMKIIADEEFLGKVLGDMVSMRASYDSPALANGKFCLEARVPAATSYEYGIRLSSLTSGKGVLSLRFDGYEPCPPELGAVGVRRGINPLDRDKWILANRNAIQM